MYFTRRLISAIFILAPSLPIWAAWRKRLRTNVLGTSPLRELTGLVLVILTVGYVYFLSAVAFVLSPWRQSALNWALYRVALPISEAYFLIAFISAFIIFRKRETARTEVAAAGVLLTLLAAWLVYGMAAD